MQRVTDDPAIDARPSVDANGTKVAFTKVRYGDRAAMITSGTTLGEIFVRDLVTGKETAVTAGPGLKHHPVMSPDGPKVIYSIIDTSNPRTPSSIHAASVAGGETEKLCDECGAPEGLSADGSKLLFGNEAPGEKPLPAVFVLNLKTRTRSQSAEVIDQHQVGSFVFPLYEQERAAIR